MSLISFNQKYPVIPADAFVAPSATLIGDVSLGSKASVWFGAILRSESEHIRIGKNSNVQDNCMIHTDEGFPVEVGDGVSVGHGAIIHGAKVETNCLVGMGAILLNGVSIGENCLIAAGSLVTQGSVMPPESLIMGSPAIAKRKLKLEEIDRIKRNSESYDTYRIEYLKMTW